ncbi:hypothetical protein NPX13_g10613 [Xylaria arbuscula]|uniref:Uncharacterized protein n=1 Tax=Xylaria arbuscula TaxID=114810 RepID=A0A9W8N4F3_9PEZI|nr:hypothetical protein NPX13_g10613 [Xylaria arbuscula]
MSSAQRRPSPTKKARAARSKRSKMAYSMECRTIFAKSLLSRWVDERQRQMWLHYHIRQLQNGDENLRRNYTIFREYYEKALNIKTSNVRETLMNLDLNLLKGYSTQTVTGVSDDDLDYVSDEEEEEEEDDAPDGNTDTSVMGNADLNTLVIDADGFTAFDPEQADQEVMESLGFTEKWQLEEWLQINSLNKFSLNSPGHNGDQSSGEANMYDRQGFFIDNNIDNSDMFLEYGEDLVMSDGENDDNDGNEESENPTSSGPSNQTVPTAGDASSASIASASAETYPPQVESSVQTPTTPQLETGIHPSALNRQSPAPASPSKPSPFAPQPVSARVKTILENLGIKLDPATRRTGKKVELTQNMLEEAEEKWWEKSDSRQTVARRNGRRKVLPGLMGYDQPKVQVADRGPVPVPSGGDRLPDKVCRGPERDQCCNA